MNSQVLYALGALIIAGFSAVIWAIFNLSKKSKQDDALNVMMEWMKEIKAGTEATRESMQNNLLETNKTINERLDAAARAVGDLKREMGSLSQIGPDIRRLTETMSSPKLRGNFGEEILENMLTDVFPKEFCRFQYRFKNGETVDAVLLVGEQILPIDSKFSMENYRLYKQAQTEETSEKLRKEFLKDVKKRIDEIHKKYILPQEGTFDYAIMFIPSEGIYMEVAGDPEIQTYGRNKKVVIVGPNTLNVTLRAVLVSLKGQQIGKAAQKVLTMINGIKQESDKFNRNLEVLTNHVKNASNAMGTVNDGYIKLKAQIVNTSNLHLDAQDTAEELAIAATQSNNNKLI